MTVDLAQGASEIKIASDFSRTPGGRYYTDGPASGQEFREKWLIPALQHNDVVTILLDGARGYPSSFLEEAFGGTVRTLRMSDAEFLRRVKLQASSDFQIYVDDIKFHVARANNGRAA